MDTNRIKSITKDLRFSLEDLIIKLNTKTPQELHDEIVPLLEDLEMLQYAVETPQVSTEPKGCNGSNDVLSKNPQFTNKMVEVKGTGGDPFDLINAATAGINGGSEPPNVIPASALLPSGAIREQFEVVVRLIERINIEMDHLPLSVPQERLKNVVIIKQLAGDLRAITLWLLHLDLPMIDGAHLESIGELPPDDNDDKEAI